MPTASEAIAILRRAMPGLMPATSADAADTEGGPEYGDPSGSLALRDLRGARESELQTRLANEQFGRQPDPNAGRTAALLKFLQGDIASDPYTGTAARGRTQHVQDTLDDAATFDRPEVTHVRNEQVADKERLATAAPRVTGEYALRRQALENEGIAERQSLANVGAVDTAHAKGGGTGHLSAALMKSIAENSNTVAGLGRLREMKKDVTTGPLAGPTQSFLQSVPLVPASKKFADFQSESSNIENNLLHALSGAAVTPSEYARLKNQVPQPRDKGPVWDSKADALERTMRGLNKRIGLLAAGVPAGQLDRFNVEEIADLPDEALISSISGGGAPAGGGQSGGFRIQR